MALTLPKSSQNLGSQKKNRWPKSALSTKHHEDNDIFCKNFEFDTKTLSKGLPINPFMSTKLHKINSDSIAVPDFMFERIKPMEDIGETQFKNFVNNPIIFGKKSISAENLGF